MMVTIEKELEQTGKVLPEGWKWVTLEDIVVIFLMALILLQHILTKVFHFYQLKMLKKMEFLLIIVAILVKKNTKNYADDVNLNAVMFFTQKLELQELLKQLILLKNLVFL